MKYPLIIIAMISLAVVGCTEKKTTKVQTTSGKEIEIPTTITYYYYASPVPGGEATYLLIKESKTAELYRTNDTLFSDLTDDEEKEFTAAAKAISEWNKLYDANPASEYEEIRKLSPKGEENIKRTFGSESPAAADRLLKTCKKIAERLQREKGRNLPA